MSRGTKLIALILNVFLLAGCAAPANETATPKVKTHVVTKRTKANKAAWASARAVSRANAASAKQLSKTKATIATAAKQASSQSEALAASQSSAKALAVSQSKAAAKSASQAAKAASRSAAQSSRTAASQASTAKSSANHFSGNTNTAQTGKIIGNTRSKIYHLPSDRNYRMSGKNVIQFSTEAEAQAAGYRHSLR